MAKLLPNMKGSDLLTNRPTQSDEPFWYSYVKDRSLENGGPKHGRPSITRDNLTTTMPSFKSILLMTTYSTTLSFFKLSIWPASINEKPCFATRAGEMEGVLSVDNILIFSNSEAWASVSSRSKDSTM